MRKATNKSADRRQFVYNAVKTKAANNMNMIPRGGIRL